MRTTNMLERVNQELRGRTRVVRVFPNEASCLRLAGALLMEINQEWMDRIYVNLDTGQPVEKETAAAHAAWWAAALRATPFASPAISLHQHKTLRRTNLQNFSDLTDKLAV